MEEAKLAQIEEDEPEQPKARRRTTSQEKSGGQDFESCRACHLRHTRSNKAANIERKSTRGRGNIARSAIRNPMYPRPT